MSASGLEHCWATQLPEVVASPLGLMELEALSIAGEDVTQHFACEWANQTLGLAKLLL